MGGIPKGMICRLPRSTCLVKMSRQSPLVRGVDGASNNEKINKLVAPYPSVVAGYVAQVPQVHPESAMLTVFVPSTA